MHIRSAVLKGEFGCLVPGIVDLMEIDLPASGSVVDDRVPSMRGSCFHHMWMREAGIVCWVADASGIHDQWAVLELH